MTTGRLNIASKPCGIIFPFPVNWTAVVFFFVLGCLHLTIAIPAIAGGRIEGELSLLLAILFLTTALLVRLTRSQIVIRPAAGLIAMTTWLGRTWFDHRIPFDRVRAVRLFLAGPNGGESRIEILCEGEDIECPPTTIPREEALYLAITIGVKLIKVYGDGTGMAASRLSGLPHGQEIAPDDPAH